MTCNDSISQLVIQPILLFIINLFGCSKNSCKINKDGDLISDLSLYVKLDSLNLSNSNNICIKDLNMNCPCNKCNESNIFSYVNSIGHALIEYVELEIGGYLIDKQYGEWMEIWNELTLNEEHKNGYKNMVGKDIEITTEKTLIIPLQFWFCKNIGLALPLIALQYHEVKLNIKIADFKNLCYKEIKKYYVSRATNGLITIDTALSLTDDFNAIDTAGERYEGMTIIWEDNLEENTIGNYNQLQVYHVEKINGKFWFAITDYQTLNEVKVVDSNGNEIESYSVGINPGDFARWQAE